VTGFADWLKQLVVTVIIATLADMLMPGKTLQPYVRMVLGLAVIATMIQPVLPLLHNDWVDKVATQAEQEFTNVGLDNASKLNSQATPLTGIRQQLQSQTQIMADQGVAKEIRQAVETHFHCTVDKIEVTGMTGTSTPLSANLTVTGTTSDSVSKIRQYIAQLLAINLQHITVQLG
jgi:stage III sporulation protein AF